MENKKEYTVSVITVSDKGANGSREDISGKTVIGIMENNGYKVLSYVVVPDEISCIKSAILNAVKINVNLILTTGGTGFSKRDVTPEATKELIQKEAAGISEAVRYYSLRITPRAMLSRGTSGIIENSIVVNLPGSPKAVEESLSFIAESLKHGIDVLVGDGVECARK